ncbi:nucleotide-binding protein, partial [mine drainage metagenome]
YPQESAMAVTKLFIGSSSAAKSQAKKFVETLSSHTLKFVPWWGNITPGQVLLDELDSVYEQVDGAVLLFSPESETKIRNDKKQIPNLNVLFEFGYFLGAFERKKIAMIKYGDFFLPSDFGGYQWIHGSRGFRRGGVQKISDRTQAEFGRWLVNF